MGPVDLTDETGATVISIEVLRARRVKSREECHHVGIRVDEELAEVTCRDCGAKLSPIRWLTRISEHWADTMRLRKSAALERARLELKRRVKCFHCGEFMTLMGSREDEKRRRATKEARMEEALERIAVLVPEAAARYAAGIARKVLAAPRGPAATPETKEG